VKGELVSMNLPDTSKWKERWHTDFKEYQDVLATAEKDCDDLKKMNRLLLPLTQTMTTLLKSPYFFDENRNTVSRYSQSLVFTSFLELFRNIHQTVFLSGCGLYKSAYHNTRYALEFIIQSYYIDTEYPDGDFLDRIDVLHDIENKRGFRGRALVNKLELASTVKEEINNEYEKLHKKVHSTHKQFKYTAYHFMDDKYHSVYVDYGEVSDIYKLLVRVVDFFYHIFLTRFPELQKSLMANEEFTDTIEIVDMPLLFDILLGRKE